jgi:hypothetical protein
MLPDFPKAKEKILEALGERIRARSLSSFFRDVKRQTCYEGDRHRIVRDDGSVAEGEFKEASGIITLDLSLSDSITEEDIIAKVDTAAQDMGSQMERHFFGEIYKSVEEVGNIIDAAGKPFTAEIYLEALERIQLDFSQPGSPHLPTLVCSPKTGAIMKEELQRLNTDPELARRYCELIVQKWNEWRERESSRKLVG